MHPLETLGTFSTCPPVWRPRARAYITRQFSCPMRARLTPTSAPRARLVAMGRAEAPAPLGVRLALVPYVLRGGVNYVTMCTPDAPRGSRSCLTGTCPARGPLGCGWSPRAIRAARPRPARTSRSCRTRLGLVRSRGAPRGACRGAVRASRVLSMREAGSSYACAAAMHRAPRPPPIGMHNGHVPRLGVHQGGSGVPRGDTVEHRARADRARVRPMR